MAKIDLTSEAWCNLVFEGKNKQYGAYRMRQESGRRHTTALLVTLLIAAVGFSLPALMKMVVKQNTQDAMVEVTTLTKLPPAEVKNNDVIKKPDLPPPPPLKSTIKFTPPVIKKDEEVREEDEIKSQEELTQAKTAISIADVKGNDEVNGADIADLREIAQEAPVEEDKPFISVEQMPQFPGGMDAMIKYIYSHIRYPQIALENGIQGRVTLQFVVGTDGNITDIKVLAGIDRVCNEEAVRVIESMPRWIPGKQNGKAVRVLFTVPVIFRIIE